METEHLHHFLNGLINGYIPQSDGLGSLKNIEKDRENFEELRAVWNYGFHIGAFYCTCRERLN